MSADPPVPTQGRPAPDPSRRTTVVVDARGLACPVPVIRLAQRVRDLAAGTLVEVWATDPAAAADIPAWCRMRGQEFVGAHDAATSDGGEHASYLVRVVAPA